MNERLRFQAWALAGFVLPPLVAVGCATFAENPAGVAQALARVGTFFELTGLAFAAVQLDSVARHWGFQGFWSRFRRGRSVTVAAIGSATNIETALGLTQARIDSKDRSILDRLEHLENSVSSLRVDVARLANEQSQQATDLKKAVLEVREAGRVAVQTLEDRVKAYAAGDLGQGFFAIFVTGWGMLIANLPTL